jgi:hypothetical protein
MTNTVASADAMMITATTRDVHLTNTDHTADARPRTLARSRLNVEEEMTGAMKDVTTTDVLLANTSPAVVASHAPRTRATDENRILVRDARIRARHLASTEIETADAVRLLLCDHEQSVNLLHQDVVHHQVMSLTATVVLDLQEIIEMTAHPDLTGMTTVPLNRNVLLLLTAKQNA